MLFMCMKGTLGNERCRVGDGSSNLTWKSSTSEYPSQTCGNAAVKPLKETGGNYSVYNITLWTDREGNILHLHCAMKEDNLHIGRIGLT